LPEFSPLFNGEIEMIKVINQSQVMRFKSIACLTQTLTQTWGEIKTGSKKQKKQPETNKS
jgi:hypothetical protein